MSLRRYLSSKTLALCMLAASLVLLAPLLFFIGADLPLVLYTEGFAVVVAVIWLTVGYHVQRAGFQKLCRLNDGLRQKYLLGEILTKPANEIETAYYFVMKEISRAAIDAVEKANREKEEYLEYVEEWIHEIKTPITACNLILNNGGDRTKIARELKRADNLAESILYYARIRTLEKDTLIQKVRVRDVIDEAIQSQMELLIASKLRVETTGDFEAYTDPKSLCFILKQLLINCAKYCPGALVTVSSTDGRIEVRDDGVGIPAHEIERVTERGFTGTNGRTSATSTGMGLFIVKEMCDRLNYLFRIESKSGEFTCVTLDLRELTKT